VRVRAPHQGRAPDGAGAPVQYGPRIAAIIVYLHAGQFLPEKRTAQALAELPGIPLSSGTVAALTARAAGWPGGFPEEVRARIAGAERRASTRPGCGRKAGCTGCTVPAPASTPWSSATPGGTRAMDATGILPSFAGVDARAPYDTYAAPDHQLCCAHAAWELQAVADAAPAGQWCRAIQAAETHAAMQRLAAEAIRQSRGAGPAALAAQTRACRSAALIGISQTAARSGKLMKKHNALARRLPDRQDDYLPFTRDFRVPAGNNGSERDIRMIKLRQKVPGCLRTLTGATQFCAIRSYLSTAARHDVSFFDAFVMLTEGRPWMPAPE
jgi:transposase